MAEMDGLELLATSRRLAPERPVIVMTAYSALDTAIESIRRGAYHYATKPFKVDEIALFLDRALDDVRLRREAASLKRALRDQFALANLVGRSDAMRQVADLVERVADAEVPVLLLGETGTGKGLVARAIHAQGQRAGAPFVSVNCAAIPEALLESELFGHAKGAFTGATSARGGLFAEADGGTLFLDEIGEMSPALQAKLLHVLESGTVRGVGEVKERAIDVESSRRPTAICAPASRRASSARTCCIGSRSSRSSSLLSASGRTTSPSSFCTFSRGRGGSTPRLRSSGSPTRRSA